MLGLTLCRVGLSPNLIGMSEIAELYRSESYSHRVAAEVRAHASRMGIYQKDIARVLGIDPSQVSGRMRGRIAFQLDELAVLARLFGVQPADLMPECTVRDSNPEPAVYDLRAHRGLVLLGNNILPITRSADRNHADTRPRPRPFGHILPAPGAA